MTVLNVIDVTNKMYSDLTLICAIIFGISAILVVIGVVFVKESCFCIGAVLLLFSFITGATFLYLKVSNNPHKEYQVIIDKNTKFYEVCDKYEIVSRDGYIYTLKDKE